MEFRYLKAFISTAKHESFTKAAKELTVAQSAISRQVRLLEESLGMQLILRSSKKVILTPAGRELFLQAQHFYEWSRGYFQEGEVTLRVGTLQGVLEDWLTHRFIEMKPDQENFPNLDVFIGTVDAIVRKLEDGDLDAGFITRPLETELVSSRKLYTEEYCLVSQSPMETKNIHKYPWIYGNNAEMLNKVSRKTSDKFIRVNSVPTILKLVELGYGIAIMPKHLVGPELKLATQDLPRLKKGTVYLATANYEIIPNAISQFLAYF